MKKYPNLLKPIKIGNLTLKNRIIAAPTGMMDLTPDGRLTPYNVCYYELKAMGGAAVVTIGESITDSKTGESHNRQIHLDDPECMPGLAHTALAIKRSGAIANIELSHGGKYGGLVSIAGEGTSNRYSYGPSEEFLSSGEHVHEMSKKMIMHIVSQYGTAAKRVKDAGFDMLMIHAGHGWLFNQFMSPKENRRTDEFGGSLENRCRFLMLALEEVRKAVGPTFPIELRMNGEDHIEGGVHLEEYLEIAKMVEDKVDLINVSCGSHEAEGQFVRTHPSMFLKHGCNVYLAEEIKKVVKVPVACVGGIGSPELAEEIIATGKADIVELGRALLADPYFPKKAMRGESDDITPCLRCFHCFSSIVDSTVVSCSVNPVIGHEFDCKYYHPPVERKKKVLIVGGGPGGMESAIIAAKRGHQVILCDDTDSLGGALKFAQYVSFKEDLYRFAQVLEKRVRKEKVEIRLNTFVDRGYVEQENPDVLIVAAGAEPIIPPIKGIHGKNVILATECESMMEQLGDSVVILGGGLIGTETGISLGMEGKRVTIIEMRDCIAPEANMFHKMAIDKEVKKYIIPCVNTTAREITPEGVICTDLQGKEIFVKADTVILSAGMRPRTKVVEELEGVVDEFYMIGDCVKAGQVTQAMSQAYFTAREI
ncbi:MAG: FAD-dependent oxidoreductase [Lachnospiraceae bacterium]